MLRPSLLAASLLAAAPAALADTVTFGCGLNPEGSLVVLGGDARLGAQLQLGVDNPLGTQTPGSIGAVYLATAPDPLFPCGTPAFGFSMSGPGAPGELLVDIGAGAFVGVFLTGAWTGPGQPATTTIQFPNLPTILGGTFYAQGVLVDPTGLGQTVLGATEALRMTVERKAGPELAVFQVTEVRERRAYAESRAFDYEYDDGVADLDAEDTAVATSTLAAQVFHDDYYGNPIGTADSVHVSVVGGRTIAADVDVAAMVEGTLFSEDATGVGHLDLSFTVSHRARFRVGGSGATDPGYNESFARLRRPGATLFSLNASATSTSVGESDSGSTQGWLEAGTVYDFEAYALASHGPDDETRLASLEVTLELLDLADFDFDGVVDQDDLDDFDDAYANGDQDADIDGDGDVDLDDRALFDAAWNAAP